MLSDQQVANLLLRDYVVVIDPGHGGKDPGATGQKGTREKDVVLQISKRLQRRLNAVHGVKAYLTRDDDTFVKLRNRTREAHKMNADVFVSVHADAVESSRPSGASVWVLSNKGARSELGRMLAKRENSVDKEVYEDYQGLDRELAYVLGDLTQAAARQHSELLANSVVDEMAKIGPMHKRRLLRNSFVVLKTVNLPSILVETGFLTNRKDEARLRNPNEQEKIAKAIAKGIMRYAKQNAGDDTKLAALRVTEHIVRSGDTLSEIADRYSVSVRELREVNRLRGNEIYVGSKLTIPR